MRPELLRYNQIVMIPAAQEDRARNAADIGRELRTLVSGCAIYKPERTQLALTGSDRVRWLNGMITNNVRDLPPGRGVYAFVLNPQGKIQADLYAFNRRDNILVETATSQLDTLLQIFDRYIIMDDVEVANLAASSVVIGLWGEHSVDVLRTAGIQRENLATLQLSAMQWRGSELTVVRGDNPGTPDYELWVHAQQAESTWQALLEAGAYEIHNDALETFRIVCGIPKFGQDIRERDLPQETSQERALHFTKGCYIGQEIVERIRSRGAVHRAFTGFETERPSLSPGTRIQSEGKDVAEVTSAANIHGAGGDSFIALGYIRKEFMLPGKELAAGDAKVVAAGLPFAGVLAKL